MDANKIIDSLGGTNEVARLCEVTKAAVSQWRTGGIPHARLMYLKAVRPDVFEKVSHGDTAPAEPPEQPARAMAAHKGADQRTGRVDRRRPRKAAQAEIDFNPPPVQADLEWGEPVQDMGEAP